MEDKKPATIGFNVILWTSLDEVAGAKNGASTVIAKRAKSAGFNIQISAPVDGCDFYSDGEVRVNLTRVHEAADRLSSQMGEAMGNTLTKAMDEWLEKMDA